MSHKLQNTNDVFEKHWKKNTGKHSKNKTPHSCFNLSIAKLNFNWLVDSN